MGRVERSVYRKKRARNRSIRRLLLILLIAAAAVLIWKGKGPSFQMEQLEKPTPEGAQNQKTITREVTLPAESWYAIQTGVFSTKDAAEQKADVYTQRGAPGVVIQDEAKWRVFIASYATEGDAAAVRTRLNSNQKVDTYLYAWVCPEVNLRLTGSEAQLDAVEAGFTLMRSSAAALRDCAIQLDAAQLTVADAAAECRALEDSVTLWLSTIQDCFGRNLPTLIQEMQRLFVQLNEAWPPIRTAKDATTMSAALKKEAMLMYERNVAWRNALLAQ